MNSGRIHVKDDISRILLLGLALMIFVLSGSNAIAMDLMGPPAAEMEIGMFRGGVEYSLSEMDLELIEGNLTVFRNGLPLGTGPVASTTIKDLEVDTLYAAFGYGVFENCEVFARMGMASATFGDSLWDEGEDFDSSNDLALGAGIKATFYEGFNWKIGGMVQINRTELDGDLNSSAWIIPQPQFIEISTTEMQIALGASYMYSSRVSFYGGPFAHFISGDFVYKFARVTDPNIDTGKYSFEINEGPNYGGYFGAQIEIAKNISGNIEYQNNSNASVLGVNLMLRY